MPELDNYHYHEALDRAYVLLDNIQSVLGRHPVILKEPEAKQFYENAVESLGVLYQKLGEISHLKKTP